jgi:hypothetical protein
MLQAIEPKAIDATLARLLTEDAREDAVREQQAADFLQYLRFMISPGVGPWSLVIVMVSLIARYLIQDSLERSTKAVPSSTIN